MLTCHFDADLLPCKSVANAFDLGVVRAFQGEQEPYLLSKV